MNHSNTLLRALLLEQLRRYEAILYHLEVQDASTNAINKNDDKIQIFEIVIKDLQNILD